VIYLFLILSFLGLATYGDVSRTPAGRTPSTTTRPLVTLTTQSAADQGIVVFSMDGTPVPPVKK
jgi:hypothetical protein